MTPEEQQMQEMNDFFGTSDVPTETNVEQVPHQKSKLDTRTDYDGVYVNTHKNKDKFKYRAAISQWNGQQNFWINLGYFNCQAVAAIAYNTAAIGIYVGGAKLNRVTPQDCATEELAEFKEKRALRIRMARVVIEEMQKQGKQFTYVQDTEQK